MEPSSGAMERRVSGLGKVVERHLRTAAFSTHGNWKREKVNSGYLSDINIPAQNRARYTMLDDTPVILLLDSNGPLTALVEIRDRSVPS